MYARRGSSTCTQRGPATRQDYKSQTQNIARFTSNINILRWQLNGSSRLWTHQFSQIQTRFNNHFCLFLLELVRIKRLRLEFEWNNVQPDNLGLFFIRKIISHFSRCPFYWLHGSERRPPPQFKNLWLNSSFWTLKTARNQRGNRKRNCGFLCHKTKRKSIR